MRHADHARPRASARLLHARARLEPRRQGEEPRDPRDQAGARGDRARAWRPPGGRRLAFQVAPGSDLGELSARLSKAGLKSETRSDITPGIAQAIVFTDPKGTSVEIFSDYTFAKDDGTDAGIMPRKLGHVAFHTPDVAGTVKFYLRRARRSRCRTGAAISSPSCVAAATTTPSTCCKPTMPTFITSPSKLRDEAEINRACDFLARKDIKLFWGPIRHLIGHNIAIYHKNSRRHHGRVLHRSRPDARRGARLFRAAAMASGQAAAAEGLGRRHPHELLGSGTSARHARAEEVGRRTRNRRLGARPRCNSFANPFRHRKRGATARSVIRFVGWTALTPVVTIAKAPD